MTTPIPQPPGVPLLGNIFDVTPSNTWTSLQTLAKKYGEIFQIKVFGQTIVFVSGAALAGELCDQKRFRKFVGGPVVEIRYAVHDSLFTAYETEASWGIAHRIIAPTLSTTAMAESFNEMRDLGNELITKWKTLGDNRISLVTHLNRLNLEATTYVLYGKRLNALDRDHPMLKAMENSTSEAVMRPTRPGFLNWLVYGSKFRSATKTLRKWAQEIVDYRKANPTDREDVLTALLNHKDPETGTKLTDSQVIDEIVTMPIGSSTAPCLITTMIYYLCKNPEIVTKAREELDHVVGDEEFTHAHLDKLEYNLAMVQEALRIATPAPGFNIEPIPSDDKSPVLLGGGKYQVAHNQAMIIVLSGANQDPSVFEDPLVYKPERMLGGAFDNLPVGVTRFFGNGKRECIGKHYAWQWLRITTAQLIKNVDFEAVNPNYELHVDGWFNIRPVDFFVKVKPRQK